MTHFIFTAPDWSKNDLVEEIVVKVLSCCQAHPFNSQRRDQAKDNPCAAKDAEHSHVASLLKQGQEEDRFLILRSRVWIEAEHAIWYALKAETIKCTLSRTICQLKF